MTVEVYPSPSPELEGKNAPTSTMTLGPGGPGARPDEEITRRVRRRSRDHGFESLNLSAAGNFIMEEGRVTGFTLSEKYALRAIALAPARPG